MEQHKTAKELREEANKYWFHFRFNLLEETMKRLLSKLDEVASCGDTWAVFLLNEKVNYRDGDYAARVEKLSAHPEEREKFLRMLIYELHKLGYHAWRVGYKRSGNFAGVMISWEEKRKFPKNDKYARYF